MDGLYEKLVYRVGSLYSLLAELEKQGMYQGEMTISYNAGGVEKTIHLYIDGTEMQFCDSSGSPGFSFTVGLD